MRSVALLIACFGIALTAAGCDPFTERQYVREGIGPNLSTDNIADRTQLQNTYINHICQQAGLASATCSDDSANANTWTMFVQAGMNDIDQRCDAYLTWLDAQRRDREPILRQLATTAAATSAIMTVSGAGTDSLTIVAEAFGLASAAYSNWNSRLLLEVNHSTVQTLVYTRQTDFRNLIAKQSVPDRPRALYLLRNYLRICLPITIETDINTSVTLVQRDAGGAVKGRPVVGTSAAPLTARQTVSLPQRPKPEVVPAYSEILDPYNSKVHTKTYVSSLLSALCAPDELATLNKGSVGPTTKAEIAIFEASYGPTRRSKTRRNGKLDAEEADEVTGLGPCIPGGGKNYFEKRTYPENKEGADALGKLIIALSKVEAGGQLPTNASLEGARAKIKAVRADPNIRAKLTLTLPDSMSDQVTPDLLSALPK